MRVLVTGHLGYIGTVLIPMLLDEGHKVIGLDSDLYRYSTFGTLSTSVTNIEKDIRETRVDDFVGFDAVIHLAGLSNDPLGDLNPSLTYEINHQATVHVAKLAKRAGVSRFLFSSSCSTYGAAGEAPIDESASFHPVTPYGESKVESEKDLSRLADDNFSPTYLRNATAFGVSPRLRFDLVLNNLVAWAYTTGKVYLKSDGMPWRPIVHIRDIAQAFKVILAAPRDLIHDEAFNVGSTDENYRIREIAQIVKETVPGCILEYAANSGPDKRTYRVNCDKIQRILPDYKPQWSARRGAQELYEAYKNIGLQLDEFEGTRYKRLAQIKELIKTGNIDASLRWNSQLIEVGS